MDLLNRQQESALCDEVVRRLSAYTFNGLRQISRISGFHLNTLHYWSIGQHRPKVENARKILRVLDEAEGKIDNT